MPNNQYSPAILLKYIRSGLTEQEHSGFITLTDHNGLINYVGYTVEYPFFQRSCAKPLQASLLVNLNLIEPYNLTSEEITICCASHAGELKHKEVVASILQKSGFCEEDLLCPASKSLTKNEHKGFGKLENNCSGKHAMMLLACKKMEFDTKDYMNPGHPLQKLILKTIMQLCELDTTPHQTKDGCGVPIYATTLEQLTKGYLNLLSNEKYAQIKQAILQNPFILGGSGRLDSEIINASKNQNLIAKVGAGGLIVVINLESQQGLTVKIQDCDMKARAITTIEALQQLNWLSTSEINTSGLNKLFDKTITTLNGTPIGKIEPCFNLA